MERVEYVGTDTFLMLMRASMGWELQVAGVSGEYLLAYVEKLENGEASKLMYARTNTLSLRTEEFFIFLQRLTMLAGQPSEKFRAGLMPIQATPEPVPKKEDFPFSVPRERWIDGLILDTKIKVLVLRLTAEEAVIAGELMSARFLDAGDYLISFMNGDFRVILEKDLRNHYMLIGQETRVGRWVQYQNIRTHAVAYALELTTEDIQKARDILGAENLEVGDYIVRYGDSSYRFFKKVNFEGSYYERK